MAARGALGVLLAGAIAGPAAAQEWVFAPRVTLGQTWTDNVTLAPDGLEESEWITELTPGFTLGRDGPRARLQLDYDLQALWFADNSDFNDQFHQLNGTGNFELAPETLFLDAFARYDQQNINTSGRVAYDNIFQTGNRTDTVVFGASPYHVGRWGTWGESLVRYQYQGTRFTNTDDTTVNVEDSDTNAISASLGSPLAGRRFSWRTSGSTSRTEFDQAPEFRYDRVALDLGLPVGLRTRLTGTVGQESDIEEDSSAGGLDANFWFVGVEWNPNELESFEGRVGNRFYGTAYEFNYTRRGARGELGLSYSEEPTTASGVLGGDDAFVPGTRPGGRPTLDTRVFLQKRLTGRADYELTRSRISAQIFASERSYQDAAGGEETNYGTRLNYDWDLAPRTTLGANLGWERREFDDTGREDDYGDLGVRLTREITRTLSGSLRASHFLRNSDDAANEYNANQVSLSVDAQF
jgi:hypothetical protein